MRNRPTKVQFQQKIEQIKELLQHAMMDGTYKAGQFLPAEKQLERMFGVSNYALRGALDQLDQEGWIEKIASIGNKVAAQRPPVQLKLACNVVMERNLQLSGLLEDFHRLYPWITIHTSELGGQYNPNRVHHDLVMLDNVQFQYVIETYGTNVFAPLDVNTRMYRKIEQMFYCDNIQHMRSIVVSPLVLCYNKAHFRELGLAEPDGSWTWDDLIHHAEMLSDGKGRYGFTFLIQSMYRWPLFLLQSGERFEWEKGQVQSIMDSKLLQSITTSKNILHNRKAVPLYLSESNSDIDRMFIEGKLSMTLNTYMGLNSWNDSNIEYDIAPVPYIHQMSTFVLGLGIGVTRASSHLEEAKLFIDYCASERAQQHIWNQTLSAPALATLQRTLNDKTLYTPSRYMLYRETLGTFRSLTELNIPISSFQTLTNLMKQYWAEMLDEQQLCERISLEIK
jgi:multiple sugar transport system substrate-binding protein